jgi:hypothetical protein
LEIFSVVGSANSEGLAHGLMGDTVFASQLAQAVPGVPKLPDLLNLIAA